MKFLVRNVGRFDREARITVSTVYVALYFGLYITDPYSELAFYIAGYYIFTGILAFSPIYYLFGFRTGKRPPPPRRIS